MYPSPGSNYGAQRGLFDRLHSNEPFKNSQLRGRIFDSSTRRHRKVLSFIPVENAVSNTERNDGLAASGPTLLDKTANKASPPDIELNHKIGSSSMPRPTKGSIDKVAEALSGLASTSNIPYMDNKMFDLQHSILRKQKRKLSRPIDQLIDGLKVPKYDDYNVKSSYDNLKSQKFGSPIRFKEYDKKPAAAINFPKIHNLKSDLADILHRRASYIQVTDRKEQIQAIYGVK